MCQQYPSNTRQMFNSMKKNLKCLQIGYSNSYDGRFIGLRRMGLIYAMRYDRWKPKGRLSGQIKSWYGG